MRPRFRSRSGPNATRDGRPLELVRVRGSQRDARPEGRNVGRGGRRSRRRGGRGTRPPTPVRRGFSFLDWLKGLFGGRPAPAPGRRDRPELGDQESRAFAEFGKQYGIAFRDPGLLKLALTHRSYLHVTGQGPRESNERLEFLGDSVLGLVTSEFLYRSHPGEHEGQLTKTKSLLVSKAILSRRALAMGLGRFVLMSHAEVESGGRQRLSILADAFESVIGAIYLDQGFEAARGFIDRWLLRESRVIAADRRHTNYKSHLQEYVQSTFRTHPVYRIRSEVGPDHSKQFMVEVMVGRRSLGEGRGQNKKEAEQAAARNALEAVESGPISDREKRRVERLPGREGAPADWRGAPPAREEETATEAEPHGGDEGDDHGRRRRRGRRGGRGRRERGEGLATGPPPATERGRDIPHEPAEREPGVERSAAPVRPPQGSRFARTAPEPPMAVTRPPELEPRPPAREEDENEEVGRPDWPGREPRVDPYAWEQRPPAVTRRPEPVSPPAPPAPVFEPEIEPEIERVAAPANEALPDDEPAFERSEPEPAFEAAEPEAPETAPWSEAPADEEKHDDDGPRYPEVEAPPPPPPAPTWGRRNRRGR